MIAGSSKQNSVIVTISGLFVCSYIYHKIEIATVASPKPDKNAPNHRDENFGLAKSFLCTLQRLK